METSDSIRHQIIKSLTGQHADNFASVAIDLWEKMATEIISIVGEGGFDSLYARSLFLAQAPFPCLAQGAFSPQTDHRFEKLRMCLEGQASTQACAANSLLLITFTDILAMLIGEQLTTSILFSAWGDGVLDIAGKEFLNE